MYTKIMFGYELKNLVLEQQNIIDIGEWAYSAYLEYCEDLEFGLRRVMLDLTTMADGPEFAISYEMLNKIADDLISGKDIDLNDAEYHDNNDILG